MFIRFHHEILEVSWLEPLLFQLGFLFQRLHAWRSLTLARAAVFRGRTFGNPKERWKGHWFNKAFGALNSLVFVETLVVLFLDLDSTKCVVEASMRSPNVFVEFGLKRSWTGVLNGLKSYTHLICMIFLPKKEIVELYNYLPPGDESCCIQSKSRWWFQIFFLMFTPIWGNDPIWRAYFSDGLVQPPTRNQGYEYPEIFGDVLLHSSLKLPRNRYTILQHHPPDELEVWEITKPRNRSWFKEGGNEQNQEIHGGLLKRTFDIRLTYSWDLYVFMYLILYYIHVFV